jgi:Fic family protein
MQKYTVAQELDVITQLIAAHPNGVSMIVLEQNLATSGLILSRRTLQRRLGALLTSNRILTEGGSRATIYKSLPAKANAKGKTKAKAEAATKVAGQSRGQAVSLPPAPTEPAELYVPLSSEGLDVRNLIRQPLMVRKPVTYDRAFLDRYRPNQDYYLTPPQRQRLHELGRTDGTSRAAGTYARDILNRLLIDLSWASSRLEGNTYSRLDTQRLIEQGQVADGKNAQETQMILNHKSAIEMLVTNAGEVDFNRFTILNLHAILSDNLMPDPLASGRLRVRAVEITGTVFLPLAMPQQIDECFTLLLHKAAQITDPFEQAFFAMVHLPYLQPFEDVNKRVSRLAANIPLIRQNLCPLAFVDVPDRAYIEGALAVYELNRVELLRDVFLWAYERSCQRYLAIRQSVGEPDAFRLKYRTALHQTVAAIVRGKLRGSDEEIIDFVRGQVRESDWEAFVDAIQSDLNYLYEGNIARYQLRFSEYQGWPFKRESG